MKNRISQRKKPITTLTWNGVTKTLPEWSKVVGIKPETLRTRLSYNWPVEKILTQKVRPKVHEKKNRTRRLIVLRHTEMGPL